MRRRTLLSVLFSIVVLGLTSASEAPAQCILTNPSFEFTGSGGQVFAGWSQFGNVGLTTESVHAHRGARVTGPNLGGWDTSGYWQRFDTEPGEQWEATVWVAHSPSNPLTGDSRAMLNIEWRNASNDIISYESHTPADSSTPPGQWQHFTVTSGPAPSGAVAAHFLLGVLQSPTEPPPTVYYDHATFYSQSYPTMDDQQWGDFPGGRTVDFSGRTWRVKGPGYYGPGPNLFSDSPTSVWVDAQDKLHLTVRNLSGSWYSTEVVLEEPLGYGDYIFTTEGRLDQLHESVVFGLFLWQYGPCWDEGYVWWGAYNEFDIEFSYWGDPGTEIGQFVAQPWDWYGNLSKFDATFSDGELTSHAFRWLPDRVECRSWRGGPYDEGLGETIHTWTYTGPHIPRPEQPRVHLNLWRCCGSPDTNQEVVLDEFTFVPEGWVGVQDPPAETEMSVPPARLLAARPNPFNPVTTIGYSLREEGEAELAVFDLAGRRVRTLVDGRVPAGTHEAVWDGLDDRGAQVASGVYFYRLRVGDSLEMKRMVLVK